MKCDRKRQNMSEKEQTYKIELTRKELFTLDGSGIKSAQSVIDRLRHDDKFRKKLSHLSHEEADFVAAVVLTAKKSGELGLSYCEMASCKLCGKQAGRAKPRGRQFMGKQLYLRGVDLVRNFVVMKGYPALGCCDKCWKKMQPEIVKATARIKACIPKEITGNPPKYKKYNINKCTKCGWKGSESKMGKLRAIMGGYYHGECPE